MAVVVWTFEGWIYGATKKKQKQKEKEQVCDYFLV
jgi:hypothetical protein